MYLETFGPSWEVSFQRFTIERLSEDSFQRCGCGTALSYTFAMVSLGTFYHYVTSILSFYIQRQKKEEPIDSEFVAGLF